MKTILQKNKSKLRRQSGLSLLEMMVATSLLVVMMLGLTAMFNQTQRAFRSGLKQVDVFEGGRAVMDLIVRDIEQMAASGITNNLYSGPFPFYPQNVTLDQPLPNGLRTNVFFGAYFLNHAADWTAISYRILDPKNENTNIVVVGSLYRLSANFSEFGSTNYLNKFLFTTPSLLTNKARLADGIVHFRLQYYDTAGNVIAGTNQIYQGTGNVQTNNVTGERITLFNNYALPAMVEVELGILEPRILEQTRSMPVASQREYLKRQAGKVHIFRQQIPIRNATRL